MVRKRLGRDPRQAFATPELLPDDLARFRSTVVSFGWGWCWVPSCVMVDVRDGGLTSVCVEVLTEGALGFCSRTGCKRSIPARAWARPSRVSSARRGHRRQDRGLLPRWHRAARTHINSAGRSPWAWATPTCTACLSTRAQWKRSRHNGRRARHCLLWAGESTT